MLFNHPMYWISAIPLSCLLGSLITGLFSSKISNQAAHWITILGIFVSLVLSLNVAFAVSDGWLLNQMLYEWGSVGNLTFSIGFLIDPLTVTLMIVVTLVSLLVHIYTIGYMKGDEGYNRFFSYISLFTFAMLMLVMSNNFLQLFFGWEAVGLVSYLLIGFWFKKDSAINASFKAFIVNRVGDFGLLLGIAGILLIFGTLDYQSVFYQVHTNESVQQSTMLTVICLLLFVGAMGKSAQIPLHVWLPDSMEGPTPISALIHAATMVTAGIFMVARMSPLFEYSPTALLVIAVVGVATATLMGLIGLVENDIKKVVAYSTLSQLGYMTVALGVSAYHIAIFHLTTHAFFKALLFLGAGSVIIAMHHEQDMRKMGALKSILPITYLMMVIGSLALAGIPPFAGFFSKDMILSAVFASSLPAKEWIGGLLLVSVFITSAYSFRLIYLVFHGTSRVPDELRRTLSESPRVVTIPLIVLAFFSLITGFWLFSPMLFDGFFAQSLFVHSDHPAMATLKQDYDQQLALITGVSLILHAPMTPAFWLAVGGIVAIWFCYHKKPSIAVSLAHRLSWLRTTLQHKYGFDAVYRFVFAKGLWKLGTSSWRYIDRAVIDRGMVHGSANLAGLAARLIRALQTGFVYHYAFAMVIGLVLLFGAAGLWLYWI